LPQLAKRS